MTVVEVRPGRAAGRVRVPGSKSYTHRALIAGLLAGRRYVVNGPLDAEDTRATAAGLLALGARVRRGGPRWEIVPGAVPDRPVVRCGASGTSLRLLSAVAATFPHRTRFTGTARLAQRPMGPLFDALRAGGATIERASRGSLPFAVSGPLRPGTFSVSATESSQFTSGLLLALPRLPGPSRLTTTGATVSEPYVRATLEVLRFHGVHVGGRAGRWSIPGPQPFRGARFRVPADASSAAYLWAAAAVTDGDVTVLGVDSRWPQADLAILDILRSCGASVEHGPRGVRVRGRVQRGFRADLTGSPDLYPLAGVIAAVAPGTSELRGAAHVAAKESDRRAGTVELVRLLGARSREVRSGLRIDGTPRPTGFRTPGWDDHRMAMSAAVGALAAGSPSRVGRADSVRKSFPTFWSTLGELGGENRTVR